MYFEVYLVAIFYYYDKNVKFDYNIKIKKSN
jgi:hypothetical protein